MQNALAWPLEQLVTWATLRLYLAALRLYLGAGGGGRGLSIYLVTALPEKANGRTFNFIGFLIWSL